MNAETKKAIRQFVLKYRAQGQLAELLGVSESFVSQWIRGRATSARLDEEIPRRLDELRDIVLARTQEEVTALAGAAKEYATR